MAKRKTHEEFIKELNGINKNIRILSRYKNARTYVECECLIDGYVWSATPDNLLRGCGCPKCAGKYKTTKTFIDELKMINPDVKVLGEYVGNNVKIKCLCLVHNIIFYSRPSDLLQGKGCCECRKDKVSKAQKMTHEEFVDKVYKMNKNIKIVGKYKSSHTNIDVECLLCGRSWFSRPNNIFSKGIVCTCQQNTFMSKGEQKIAEILEIYGINYYYQQPFEGLIGVNNGLLSYDFYLSDYNLLIEFQGEQHYKSCEIFGGEEKFKIQQEHDKRKQEYALSHKIDLLSIPYNKYTSIEKILIDKLNIYK